MEETSTAVNNQLTLTSPPLPTLPFDLIQEILRRLPVKLLFQLRCVCKPWNSLISDHKFIMKIFPCQPLAKCTHAKSHVVGSQTRGNLPSAEEVRYSADLLQMFSSAEEVPTRLCRVFLCFAIWVVWPRGLVLLLVCSVWQPPSGFLLKGALGLLSAGLFGPRGFVGWSGS
ncbi:F-box-like protein [Medicago truncatula]|uniref:F-box-like protein n=1 Tax=Medicago truncatula TaxID=3880 RepID=G7IVP7_MEDTR|nr:F-box-like protein [Medicago truncatula]